jgi:predicted metal-dependent enzyme (double-stranded beta helix superfamily)
MTLAAPRFGAFIAAFAALLDRSPAEPELIDMGGRLLARLVAADDWLPAALAEPRGGHAHHLLHRDPVRDYCVVSFVLGPAARTPIHDHTVWGLIGLLRGAEIAQPYAFENGRLRPGAALRLAAGEVTAVSPRIGDIHRVGNALTDRPSVSIHVYGGDIGVIERFAYQPDGQALRFVSPYSDSVTQAARAAIV